MEGVLGWPTKPFLKMKWNEYYHDDHDNNYDARDNNYDLLIDISHKEKKPEFVDAPNHNHPPSNIDLKKFHFCDKTKLKALSQRT